MEQSKHYVKPWSEMANLLRAFIYLLRISVSESKVTSCCVLKLSNLSHCQLLHKFAWKEPNDLDSQRSKADDLYLYNILLKG